MSESVTLKYRAFLCYAHADTSWARWLHGRLEGFHIDEDLVGGTTEIGPVPRSLRPIFRDREDFSGGRTLIDATIAELDQSAALIVVCSTVSAERPAVQEEVRLFRSRHPDRPVIPVIVDGTYPTNFPPGLRFELGGDCTVTDRPVTVLGPDLRETGDGRSLGLAKVVAGLTGLDTDVIFRRAERARRRRRRLMSTATVIVLAVVLSLFGWAEIQRRRFATYLELATKFKAFEVTDVTAEVTDLTAGWDDRRKLAQDTLAAMREIVSDRLGFRTVKILWFDDKPHMSREAKQRFLDGMRGVGVSIQEVEDISVVKNLIRKNFDVVIANYGSPEHRFVYQVLSEIAKQRLDTPLVIYGLKENPGFAKEARCYGAVARATTIDQLFSAVMRALAADTRPRVSNEQRLQCIEDKIKPYDTPAWRQWLDETKAGKAATMPELNWN